MSRASFYRYDEDTAPRPDRDIDLHELAFLGTCWEQQASENLAHLDRHQTAAAAFGSVPTASLFGTTGMLPTIVVQPQTPSWSSPAPRRSSALAVPILRNVAEENHIAGHATSR